MKITDHGRANEPGRNLVAKEGRSRRVTLRGHGGGGGWLYGVFSSLLRESQVARRWRRSYRSGGAMGVRGGCRAVVAG